MNNLYDKDLHAWSQEQASLLRQFATDPPIPSSMVQRVADEMKGRWTAAREEALAAQEQGRDIDAAFANGEALAASAALSALSMYTGINSDDQVDE